MNINTDDPGYRLWLGQLKSTGVDVGDRDQVLARHRVEASLYKMLLGFGILILVATLPLLLTPLAPLFLLISPLSLLGAVLVWLGRRKGNRLKAWLALHQAQMGWPA